MPFPTAKSSIDEEHIRALRHLVAEMYGGLKQEVHALKEELDTTKQILEVTRQEAAAARQEAAAMKQEAAVTKQETYRSTVDLEVTIVQLGDTRQRQG